MTLREGRAALMIAAALLPTLFGVCTTAPAPTAEDGFYVVEATISDMQRAMEDGLITSLELDRTKVVAIFKA